MPHNTWSDAMFTQAKQDFYLAALGSNIFQRRKKNRLMQRYVCFFKCFLKNMQKQYIIFKQVSFLLKSTKQQRYF